MIKNLPDKNTPNKSLFANGKDGIQNAMAYVTWDTAPQSQKDELEMLQMTAWSQRNGAAMKAFIARSESGMNLSDRVWQSTRQLRDEMEIAITVAVGDGTSAASLSRNVRRSICHWI